MFHSKGIVYIVIQSPSLHLSPSEDEEWVALQEQLAEEEQEHKALQERRREISEKIDKQNDEIMRVKNENTALQTKVNNFTGG